MKVDYLKIMGELTYFLKGYSDVKRANVNCFRCLEQNINSENYDVGDIKIQESLLEHVGSLPIIAVFFYPYLGEKVDLGKVLQMLAIHDIGEVVLGDEITFTKESKSDDTEEKEALKLLDKSFHGLYKEFKEGKTKEALFALSLDKIAPNLLNVITDIEITKKRLKFYANISPEDIADRIEKSKSPHMQWNPFLKSFHAQLMENLRDKIKTSM